MKGTFSSVPKRPIVAALLCLSQGLSGCSSQAPDAKGGAGAASGTAQIVAGPGRNELVVGFLPVT